MSETVIKLENILKFIEKVNKYNDHKIEDRPIQLLRKYELLRNEKNTNACYLLFSKNDIITQQLLKLADFRSLYIKLRTRKQGEILGIIGKNKE